MFPFTWLYSFLETLESYFGEVTENSIKENFDIVYMVSTSSSDRETLIKLIMKISL
jgi:hypothetical protein